MLLPCKLNPPILAYAMLLSELLDSRLAGNGINVKDTHPGSLANQTPCKLQPEALGASCDDGSAAFWIKIVVCHFLLQIF